VDPAEFSVTERRNPAASFMFQLVGIKFLQAVSHFGVRCVNNGFVGVPIKGNMRFLFIYG
jgi:hypothetical protein